MANALGLKLSQNLSLDYPYMHPNSKCILNCTPAGLHTTAVAAKEQAGKYKVTLNRTKPLTYEMAMQPQKIASHKSWNSFNTAQLEDTFLMKEEMGQDLPHKTFMEDAFVRKFMFGTWPELLLSEVRDAETTKLPEMENKVAARVQHSIFFAKVKYHIQLVS